MENDIHKVSRFKSFLIVRVLSHIANKEIDQGTVQSLVNDVSDYFKDKDEQKVIKSIITVLAKLQIGFKTRLDNLRDDGSKKKTNEGTARMANKVLAREKKIKGRR